MNIFSFFYEIILIIMGCLLASFGTANFLLPNQLSSGGFAGIATIFYYFFNIQMGTTIMVLNIPLFIWGYLKMGWKFILKTIFATFLYSGLIDIFANFSFFVSDRLLSSIYGGVLIGSGLALVLKANTSTGGTDLIAYIAQNYNVHIKMSNIIMIIDILVVFTNLIVFRELEIGLYSGATGLYGKGSFSQKDKMIIMCVSKRRDIEKIKTISKKIDSKSFIIVTDAREVYGLGFK